MRSRYASLKPFYSGGRRARCALACTRTSDQPVTDQPPVPLPAACTDLLDDLGATDVFVVDGDALLADLLSSERLDWAHGGQFLQLRAALEAFVAGVAAANTAGLRWHVVWFEASAALLPGAAAAAARALAQAWLEGLGVPTLRFRSWWDAGWAGWLGAARPAMLLLTDLPGAAGSGGGEGAEQQRRRLFLQAQVVHCQEAGTQCAFLSELRFLAEGAMHAFRTGWRPAAAAAAEAYPMQAAAAAVGAGFAPAAAPGPPAGLDVPGLLHLAASHAEELGEGPHAAALLQRSTACILRAHASIRSN